MTLNDLSPTPPQGTVTDNPRKRMAKTSTDRMIPSGKPNDRHRCMLPVARGIFQGSPRRLLNNPNATENEMSYGYRNRSYSNWTRAPRAPKQPTTATIESAQAWLKANPAEAAWLESASQQGFDFATSVLHSLHVWGALTERQEAAVRSATAKAAAGKAAAQARVDNAVEADASKIEAAFDHARGAGLKKLSLRLAGYVFKPAPIHGRNPGAIYVTDAARTGQDGRNLYLGKVDGGKFIRSRDCDDDAESSIVAICIDPHAAAVATGLQTGICSCCGRELTNEESVELGIGPICREKWGWK